MIEPKRVLIVQEGTFGPEHYESYVGTLKGVLESVQLPKDAEEEGSKPAAIVEIVSSGKEAETRAAKREVDIVIFVSGDMHKFAQQLRTKFKQLVVYVLTGRDVADEPYLIPKRVLTYVGIGQM